MSTNTDPIQTYRDAAADILADAYADDYAYSGDELPRALAQLEAAALQLAQQIGADIIGADEAPKPKPRSKDFHTRLGTCWACYEEDYCTHEIRDVLRAEQRRSLTRLTGQGGNANA